MTKSWRIADEEALRYRCRKCGAKPGAMCVRLSESTTPWHWSDEHGCEVQITYLPGEPCKVTHNERRYTAQNKRMEQIRRAHWASRTKEMAEAAEVSAARAGWAHAANVEWEEMRAWLKANSRLLTDLGSAAPAPVDRAVPVP